MIASEAVIGNTANSIKTSHTGINGGSGKIRRKNRRAPNIQIPAEAILTIVQIVAHGDVVLGLFILPWLSGNIFLLLISLIELLRILKDIDVIRPWHRGCASIHRA